MAAADKNKDREMAAYLVRSGYPHGRRMTSGHCPVCYGPQHGATVCNAVGSTKYRRYLASRQNAPRSERERRAAEAA